MDQQPTPSGDSESQDAIRVARLQSVADSLAEKRKKAVEFRARSGIEQEWQEDDDHYNAIDELSRDEAKYVKGATPNSPMFTTAKQPAKSTKSTVFMPITQTYVDMAAASVADMLLPTDDMPFAILPRPEPDIEGAVDDQTTMQAPSGEQATAGQIATKMLAQAQASADKAETQIWDWLVQSQWHAEVRAVIFAAARIGTGCLKGPTPVKKKSKKIDRRPGSDVVQLTMVERTIPVSKVIDVRNIFPDPACGEDIHSGSFIWERDDITARELRDLKGTLGPDGKPLYLDDQIDLVLQEGPDRKYAEGKSMRPDAEESDRESFRIWYYNGTASADDMAAAGCQCSPGSAIPVVITTVNDRVIKANLSTLDSGSFPYDLLAWQKVSGRWAGRSESRKIRTPQRILNGAVRALMDNSGLSSGPQIIIDTESIEPADGNWEITPRKVWKKKGGATIADVSKAISDIKIDSIEPELSNVIKFALEMADRCATMPIQQQGQQGVTQETAEGRRLLQNNASVQKRALAKTFDDDITEPHITRYYEWLLLYGEDPDAKREFVIDARGSSVLFERDAQNMAVAQIANFVKDPEFDIDPKRWIAEYFKSNKLDPARFQYTAIEAKAIAAQRAKQPQPQDPKVEVAQVQAASREKVATIQARGDQQDVAQREQENREQLAADATDAQQEREHEREMKSMDYQMMLMEYANKRGIGLDAAKVELAKTAMELRMQNKLSEQDKARAAAQPQQPPPQRGKKTPRVAPQVAPAATEPAGRAAPGKAFEQ